MDLAKIDSLVADLSREVEAIKQDLIVLKAGGLNSAEAVSDLKTRIEALRVNLESASAENKSRDTGLNDRLSAIENRLTGKQGVLLLVYLIAQHLLAR